MEEEGVTDSYDVESRVNGTVEEAVTNDVHEGQSRAIARVEEGSITTFTDDYTESTCWICFWGFLRNY